MSTNESNANVPASKVLREAYDNLCRYVESTTYGWEGLSMYKGYTYSVLRDLLAVGSDQEMLRQAAAWNEEAGVEAK